MAKVRHNKVLDSIVEIISDAKDKGVVHLYTEDERFSGRRIQIKGQDHYHFGTTGYLGLEQDIRLKEAAIDAIMRYGTQFPLSKTYISFGGYKELEENLFEMYGSPILISKNSTLGHLAVIPSIVRDEDVVIMDQQVHASVQGAVQQLKVRGIPVEILRHNDLEMLENRIKLLQDKYEKIWYLVDGVYSMFGDCTPIVELVNFLNKYPKFHLYVDDVHGMSWAGKNGTGYIMSKIGEQHEKMVLTGTLSKSFGASGGVTVFKNQEFYKKAKTFGGPLTFSAQLEPPLVAAALASSKIHLSEEIYDLQRELQSKISFCNSLIRESDLPLIEENNCPVFFIGTAYPKVGYNFVKRLMREGFYVNFATFPVVPVKNTGVRFTVSRHNQYKDIEELVNAMKYHYPKALEEESCHLNEIRRHFKLPLVEVKEEGAKEEILISGLKDFDVFYSNNISEISNNEWNSLLGHISSYDYAGLKSMEEAFKVNKPNENWKFHYYIIKDKSGIPVVATFFTSGLFKDDMLSPAAVSMEIEKNRKHDPFYLTSKIMGMGSLITEGNHLFLNKEINNWEEAFKLLLKRIEKDQEKENASMVILRDFDEKDISIKNILIDEGFVKLDLPESSVQEDMSWGNLDDYINTLSYKSRRHLRKEILKYEDNFLTEIKGTLTTKELNSYYQLYKNVKDRNLEINSFDLPLSFFEMMNNNTQWEFIELKIKPELSITNDSIVVAVMFCYKNFNSAYIPLYVGLDYNYVQNFNSYKQILFQTLKRAKALNCKKINWGMSASFEKKKLGANVIPKVAYIQTKDNYSMEIIGMTSQIKQ